MPSSSNMSQSWSIEGPQRLELPGPVRSVKLNAVACRFNIIGTRNPVLRDGESASSGSGAAQGAGEPRDARPGDASGGEAFGGAFGGGAADGGAAAAVLEVKKVVGPPLEMILDNGYLTLRHRAVGQPNMLGWLFGRQRMEVELSLAVPADCSTRVNIVSGSVVASALRREVVIRTVSGDVTLAGLHGGTRAETVSGTITAEQVTGDLKANALSGSITVIAGAGGALDLSAVSGTIALDLENPMPPTVKVHCVSGSITARLPHQPDVTVDVKAANGRATSAFPEIPVRRANNAQRLTGSLGSGAARLSGQVMSGAVTLLRRDADDEGGEEPRDAAPGTDHPRDAF